MGKWRACLSPHTKPQMNTIWWLMTQIPQIMMCLPTVTCPQQLVHWQYCNQRGTATARGRCTCREHLPHCTTVCCPWSSARQGTCLPSHLLHELTTICFALLQSWPLISQHSLWTFLNAELYRKSLLHWGKHGKQSAIQEWLSFYHFHPQR